MLPFIGSIRSNCCFILHRRDTPREDLDGGILTTVGARMDNSNNTIMEIRSKELSDNEQLSSLINDETDNFDNDVVQSADDILHFHRTLARSAESLYPYNIKRLQPSTIRRHSHNLCSERRRSSLWTRTTTEELMARASRRASDDPKSSQHKRFEPVKGRTLVNLSNLFLRNFLYSFLF